MLEMLVPEALPSLSEGIMLAQAGAQMPPVLYDSTSDIIKTAALLLAVILPVAATIWSTRREMRKPDHPANVGKSGLIAIGGALASEGGTMLYITALEKHSKSLDLQTEALNRLAVSNLELARSERDKAAEIERAAEEASKMRRAQEDIAELLRRLLARDQHP